MVGVILVAMSERLNLSGRKALVTGAAGAVAQVVARDLKNRGAYVIGMDSSVPQEAHFFDEVIRVDLGSSSIPSISCPVEDLDAVIHLAGRALPEEAESHGSIPERSVIEQTINDNFMSLVDVVAITRPALTSNSSITVVSSINSLRAFGLPIYSAAKGAVNAFVISIAPQLLAEGIRINAIALGTVEWAGGRDRRAASRKVFRKLSKTIPDGRPLTTEEASRSILSVGIDSPGISGSVTVVDRGQSNFVNLGR